MVNETLKIKITRLETWFDQIQALKSITLDIWEHEILGVIGPANSGKTTFLRSLNRFNDLNPKFKMRGEILLDQRNIYPGRSPRQR